MKSLLFQRGLNCLALSVSALFVLVSCEDQPQVEKPEKTITKAQATAMSHRFVNDISTLMEAEDSLYMNSGKARQSASKNASFVLTSHAYYSVEELEHYFAWAKQQAEEKGYDLKGFRFYFGTYPNDEQYGDRQNFTTMFLSPAGDKTQPQKGETVALPFTIEEEAPEDIEDIDPYNYAGNGNPPRAKYND